MAVQQTSRVYNISLPLDLAEKAESLAKSEARSVSDVLGEALRSYGGASPAEDSRSLFEIFGEYAASRPHNYTEEDIPRLIREVREEERSEAAGRSR